MKAVIQIADQADVKVNNELIAQTGRGYLIFLAIHTEDTEDKIQKMADKISNLRIFPDSEDKMNLSIKDIQGEILLVSQFTLYGDAAKGNRPSFSLSARPDKAENYYKQLAEALRNKNLEVKTGKFGAHMLISLVNNGPCTIIIDL